MAGTADVNEHAKTEELRRDIARTQHEMTETIHEIQRRLSPRYMAEQTKDSMRRTGVNIIDKIKTNPIPAMMAGAGLWLLFRGSDDAGSRDAWEYDQHPGRLDEVKYRASEKAHEIAESARETTSRLKESASETAHHVSEVTRRRAQMTRIEAKDFLREQPLVAGLAAIALGAIIGAAIPETDKENALMGETRDRLLDRAENVAREGVNRAKHVAQVAKSVAKDEVRDLAHSAGQE